MSLSIKNIRKDFKSKGVFYTPPELALKMTSFIDLPDVREVYDPTCGDGGLLRSFPDEVCKFGQELNPAQAQIARETLANAHIAEGDTLVNPAFADRKFQLIMANPPFSVAWDNSRAADDERFACCPAVPPKSKADYAFLLHIWHMLADGGEAVVLNFPGILYRGNSEGAVRRWMVENDCIEKVVRIPKGTFEDTNIETALLVLKKGREGGSILFRDDELGIERWVEKDEVQKNGYNLSVNSYVQPPEPERPPFDPRQMELDAQDNVLRVVKLQIGFSCAVAEVEGWDLHKRLIVELRKLIENEEQRMHLSGDSA